MVPGSALSHPWAQRAIGKGDAGPMGFASAFVSACTGKGQLLNNHIYFPDFFLLWLVKQQ